MSIGSIPIAVIYGDISLISKALDCDSSRYRCKSYISPQFKQTPCLLLGAIKAFSVGPVNQRTYGDVN